MKWVWRILALGLMALVMGYGLTRFLAASELRQAMADAERRCSAFGGLQEFELLEGEARLICADGSEILMALNF